MRRRRARRIRTVRKEVNAIRSAVEQPISSSLAAASSAAAAADGPPYVQSMMLVLHIPLRCKILTDRERTVRRRRGFENGARVAQTQETLQ